MFSEQILITPSSNLNPPIPLDVDNGLHFYSCVVMNTGNLHVHHLLITNYHHLVAEYIQYDDATPFQPLQLACAVHDLDIVEYMHDKLTAIVRYWLRYAVNGKRVTLSVGLGVEVGVNSLV